MEALLAALADERCSVPLDIATLELAEIEYPGLDHGPPLEMLDRLASRTADHLDREAGGADFVEAANHVIFETYRFHGNETNYYDPRNSFLNDVLARRTGIPLTLSIVYIEVARRLARPVYGVGLPGHFLVRYDDSDYQAFLDPFHTGRALSAEQCHELAKSVTGTDASANPLVLSPVSTRYILVRMLNNLKAIYLRQESWEKVLPILNLLLHAMPGDAGEHRTRGLVHMRLQRLADARTDLRRYLDLAPDPGDREAIAAELRKIHRMLAALN